MTRSSPSLRRPARWLISPAFRDGLLIVVGIGVLLVLLLPAARAHWTWLGWGPLWLVGMPLSAWWLAAGVPLPTWPPRVRRRGPQARRLHGHYRACERR